MPDIIAGGGFPEGEGWLRRAWRLVVPSVHPYGPVGHRAGGTGIDFERLALLLEDRLQPVVPSRVHLQAEGPMLVMCTEGFQGRTHLALDYNAGEGGVEESLEDPIGNSLTQIADEASEATTDRYECDFAFEDDGIRLWFGLCPQTPTIDTDWSEVLPELSLIRFSEFITDREA